MWRSWIIGFLGMWVIAAPFLFYPGSTQTAVFIGSGLLIVLISLWKIVSEQKNNSRQ